MFQAPATLSLGNVVSETGAAMECEETRRERVYRLVIGSSIAFSLVSVLAAAVTLPLLFNFARHAQHSMDRELSFCHDSAVGVWAQVLVLRGRAAEIAEFHGNRTVRQSGYAAQAQDVVHKEVCEECCIPGPKGTPGPPGREGGDGPQGPDGAMGTMGKGPPPCIAPLDLTPCPECPSGPQGPDGCNGDPGDVGEPGLPGEPGKPGDTGQHGPLGDPGPYGPPGVDGPVGDPGPPAPNAVLIPGDSGEPGDPGPVGVAGPKGHRGEDGARGYIGARGVSGPPGDRGSEGPRGPAGLPGYGGKIGESGVCPTYCASDGGVFFEKGQAPPIEAPGDTYNIAPPADDSYGDRRIQ